MYDVIIVGAGPAGLSAALILGRCRRRVLVCDTGRPRNAASHAMHGYLSRDGMPPAEFLRIAREQMQQYDTVEMRDVEVRARGMRRRPLSRDAAGRRPADGAQAADRDRRRRQPARDSRLPGVLRRSVFHCPYCDGWEVRDQPLAVYGRGARGLGLSLELTGWSRDIVLCTDGPSELDADDLARLTRNGIVVRDEPRGPARGRRDGSSASSSSAASRWCARALFFTTGQTQQSELAQRLGCEINEKGTVRTGKYEATHLTGLYVAGDASRAVQWVVVAAAEGAEAAFAINTDLLKEDLL